MALLRAELDYGVHVKNLTASVSAHEYVPKQLMLLQRREEHNDELGTFR